MAPRLVNPFILFLAHLTNPQLVRAVQFLKAENRILRSKLPRVVPLTTPERKLLTQLAEPLGLALKGLVSLVSYRTYLRWKAEKRAKRSPKAAGSNPARKPDEVRELVIRLGRENHWGYTRILGELKKLGVGKISRNTVRNILKAEGLEPGPERGPGTWDEFVKIHWDTLYACDFFAKEVWTLAGRATSYVLFFVELKTRRVYIAGMTTHPEGEWVAQAAREMRMRLEEEGKKPSYIIKDGDTKLTAQFGAILEATGATMKRIPRKSPNLNPYCETWVSAIKRECLDHFLVLGHRHLEYLVTTYAAFHNSVRPHEGLGGQIVGVGKMPKAERTKTVRGIACDSWLGGVLKHYRRAA